MIVKISVLLLVAGSVHMFADNHQDKKNIRMIVEKEIIVLLKRITYFSRMREPLPEL
jgi:membrane-anchored glycerophosphoryl diester phosphodiesterase (GDPDase)